MNKKQHLSEISEDYSQLQTIFSPDVASNKLLLEVGATNAFLTSFLTVYICLLDNIIKSHRKFLFIPQNNVMVPMRDGISLATNIYRPVNLTKPGPVLLLRTPYGKHTCLEKCGYFFINEEYTVVVQDVRGRYKSEGVFQKYVDEAYDGYDTIEWIYKQPWCNGKIGTLGTSYLAHTQMAAAILKPPGLSCMWMDEGGFSNAYQNGIRMGGAFEIKQLTWAFKHIKEEASPELADKLKTIDIKKWLLPENMPWKKGNNPLMWTPEYESYVLSQWQSGTFTDEWLKIGLYAKDHYNKLNDIPTVVSSGWYDEYTTTIVENYIGIKNNGGQVRMIIGPWIHGLAAKARTVFGDVDFGENSLLEGNLAPNFNSLMLEWFDYCLKGKETKFTQKPSVAIFVMGGEEKSGTKTTNGNLYHGGRWRWEEDWPLTNSVPTNFYLGLDGSLSLEPSGEGERFYFYDPLDPVPTIGGNIASGDPVMSAGAFDQVEGKEFFPSKEPFVPLAERQDVLVYQTQPLNSNTEVTGSITANLWVSSDCLDTDFTIKLIDVYPPNEDYPKGYAMNIAEGILRMRYRNNSWANPQLMNPNEIYPICINVFPTSNIFAKGHRIRVDISSSNYPHFDINPNTGEPEGRNENVKVARNSVWTGGIWKSCIVLPVVNYDAS